MRILMVNKFYPPDIGGVETVVAQYAQAARADGAEVEVLACHSRSGIPTETVVEQGIRVTRCRSWGTLWSMPVAPSFLIRYFAMFRRFDLVHFHEPYPLGTVAAVLTRARPFVITWHSDVIRQWLVKPLLQPLQRLACRRAAWVTTTSQALAEISPVLSTPGTRIRVIPLSVNLDAATSPSGAARAVTGPYCLFLGRLARYKGLDTLAAALQYVELASHKLVIVGHGPERQWLDEEMRTFADRVVVIDRHVTEAEKQSFLAHCSFLIFPSSEENEAFGIVQLEAMAHGKPVINTNLPGGVPWVSPHEQTGLTVPPKDPVALASAIQRMIESVSTRESLGRNARERVHELFSDQVVLPRVLDMYREVAASAD